MKRLFTPMLAVILASCATYPDEPPTSRSQYGNAYGSYYSGDPYYGYPYGAYYDDHPNYRRDLDRRRNHAIRDNREPKDNSRGQKRSRSLTGGISSKEREEAKDPFGLNRDNRDDNRRARENSRSLTDGMSSREREEKNDQFRFRGEDGRRDFGKGRSNGGRD